MDASAEMSGEVTETLEESLRSAKRALGLWMKQQGYHQVTSDTWTRWTYGERPFWSVYAVAYSRDYRGFMLGFNIYDDGEVVCVSRKPEEICAAGGDSGFIPA